jgi:hypothetical protein
MRGKGDWLGRTWRGLATTDGQVGRGCSSRVGAPLLRAPTAPWCLPALPAHGAGPASEGESATDDVTTLFAARRRPLRPQPPLAHRLLCEDHMGRAAGAESEEGCCGREGLGHNLRAGWRAAWLAGDALRVTLPAVELLCVTEE